MRLSQKIKSANSTNIILIIWGPQTISIRFQKTIFGLLACLTHTHNFTFQFLTKFFSSYFFRELLRAGQCLYKLIVILHWVHWAQHICPGATLASDWSRVITWPGYWPMIGREFNTFAPRLPREELTWWRRQRLIVWTIYNVRMSGEEAIGQWDT